MRISDWSSDVCSSDLFDRPGPLAHPVGRRPCPECMPARSPGIAGKRYRVYSGACRGFAMQVFLLALWTSMILLNYSEASKQVLVTLADGRSEERRVGKECVSTCRSWW